MTNDRESLRACRRRKHVWKVVDKIEQPSSVEVFMAAGTPITAKGAWPDQINALSAKPVVVTRECAICGTQEVSRV